MCFVPYVIRVGLCVIYSCCFSWRVAEKKGRQEVASVFWQANQPHFPPLHYLPRLPPATERKGAAGGRFRLVGKSTSLPPPSPTYRGSHPPHPPPPPRPPPSPTLPTHLPTDDTPRHSFVDPRSSYLGRWRRNARLCGGVPSLRNVSGPAARSWCMYG